MTKTRSSKSASTIDGGKRTVEAPQRATQSRHANPEFAPPAPPALSTATKPVSKQQQLAALVVRDEGATLEQMIAVTGWLPHTTRAALTGLRKKGYVISSDKVDGVRTYRAVAPE
jgi:hypothetical protein